MSHKLFIPLTDELMYEKPELVGAELAALKADEPAVRWRVELNPADTHPSGTTSKLTAHRQAAQVIPFPKRFSA